MAGRKRKLFNSERCDKTTRNQSENAVNIPDEDELAEENESQLMELNLMIQSLIRVTKMIESSAVSISRRKGSFRKKEKGQPHNIEVQHEQPELQQKIACLE